ncbi:MAG: hypothetical protein JXL84_13950 [Deltaproteobacteria bacterium]|nr:hypothetical protein [Deltaproteobacteria bacterium]
MKIAVCSEGPELDARMCDRLGLSPYLLIVDLESKGVEVIRSPRHPAGGSGMQMVGLIIAKKCDVLIAKWCSPTAERHLTAHGVGIVTGMSGTVADVLEKFENKRKGHLGHPEESARVVWKVDRRIAVNAIRSAANQIKSLFPVMVGVVFLVGLFSAFLAEDLVNTLFTGSWWWDSLWGASLGSLLAGNPINSYIIGRQLLKVGVSLVAVTAFICSWVTVGLVQLPAEAAALGWKFAVLRNLSCFGLSMVISLTTMFIVGLFGV